MKSEPLTEAGRAYLRAAYISGATERAIGPARIARSLGVSRVTALEQLRKLARLGYGTYVQGKGLMLNKKGTETTQEDIWRHHVVEHIFASFFDSAARGSSHDMVCEEATKTSAHFSRDFLDMVYESMGSPDKGQCGCPLNPPFVGEEMEGCGWYRKMKAQGR